MRDIRDALPHFLKEDRGGFLVTHQPLTNEPPLASLSPHSLFRKEGGSLQ